jgi:hypothetical protein
MPTPNRFANITHRPEDPPSDDGAPVDVLAGSLSRAFYRLTKLERYVIERVAALEGTPRAAEGARGNVAAAGRASR